MKKEKKAKSLPHNHMGMMGQQQPNSINQNALSKQQQQQQQQTAAMLSYNNTKPLSHFSGSGVDHIGQRMTPPMGGNNQVKNPMMPPYMGGGGGGQGAGPGQTQGPIPGQTAHLSEEQKRVLLMKQKIDDLIAKNEKLQELLAWTHKKAMSIDSRYKKLAAIRSIYFSIDYYINNNNYSFPDLDLGRNIDPIIDKQIAQDFRLG